MMRIKGTLEGWVSILLVVAWLSFIYLDNSFPLHQTVLK